MLPISMLNQKSVTAPFAGEDGSSKRFLTKQTFSDRTFFTRYRGV